jgi:hypothetical protein
MAVTVQPQLSLTKTPTHSIAAVFAPLLLLTFLHRRSLCWAHPCQVPTRPLFSRQAKPWPQQQQHLAALPLQMLPSLQQMQLQALLLLLLLPPAAQTALLWTLTVTVLHSSTSACGSAWQQQQRPPRPDSG